MSEQKAHAIKFNKWLFDNNFVPNKSFLWFDYTKSHKEVLFFELGELYYFFEHNTLPPR